MEITNEMKKIIEESYENSEAKLLNKMFFNKFVSITLNTDIDNVEVICGIFVKESDNFIIILHENSSDKKQEFIAIGISSIKEVRESDGMVEENYNTESIIC